MRYLPNIEKSAFHKGEYVGYAKGVWHIYKRKESKQWEAFKQNGPGFLSAATLAGISDRLMTLALAK